MKNYVIYVNDHSGSMSSLAKAAMSDYNANISATRDAANTEMMDTIVSVYGIGLTDRGAGYKRQVIISNPHVLKPVSSWPTPGGTPLYDTIGAAITDHMALPDANDPSVSFLLVTTTDGYEMHSTKYTKGTLRALIERATNTGRWTFVFRVPVGMRDAVAGLGVPDGNIVEWETTAQGMAESQVKTKAAVDTFYKTRSAGATSSSAFYTNAANVSTAALVDVSKEVSLYVVPADAVRLEMKDFILSKRQVYMLGGAFYQLTKTEARVQPDKLIAIRERTTGKVFSGADARAQLGLSSVNNVRLHPGDHGNYDIFIQSKSVNRLLVPGTGVLYWEKQGRPMTQADLDLYKKPAAPVAPPVVQLPAVPVSTRPTPSPIPKISTPHLTPNTVAGRPVVFFRHRDEARDYARKNGGSQRDLQQLVAGNVTGNANGFRWYVLL